MPLTETMAMAAKNRGVSVVLTTNTESASTTSEGTTMVATIIPVMLAILGDGMDLEEEEYIVPSTPLTYSGTVYLMVLVSPLP